MHLTMRCLQLEVLLDHHVPGLQHEQGEAQKQAEASKAQPGIQALFSQILNPDSAPCSMWGAFKGMFFCL